MQPNKFVNLNSVFLISLIIFFFLPNLFSYFSYDFVKFRINLNSKTTFLLIISLFLFFLFSLIKFKKYSLFHSNKNIKNLENKIIWNGIILFIIGLILKYFGNSNDVPLFDFIILAISSFNIFQLLAIIYFFYSACLSFIKKNFAKSFYLFVIFIIFVFFSFLNVSRTSTLLLVTSALIIIYYLEFINFKKFFFFFIVLFLIFFLLKSYIKLTREYYKITYKVDNEIITLDKATREEVDSLYNVLNIKNSNNLSFKVEKMSEKYFFNYNIFYIIMDRINSFHIFEKIINSQLNYHGATFTEFFQIIFSDKLTNLLNLNSKVVFTDGKLLAHFLKLSNAQQLVYYDSLHPHDDPNDTTGIGPTLFGDLYLNFQYMGLFLLVPLVALLFNFFSNFFVNYLYTPLSIPTYALFIVYQNAHIMDWTSTHVIIFIKFVVVYATSILIFNFHRIFKVKNFLQ